MGATCVRRDLFRRVTVSLLFSTDERRCDNEGFPDLGSSQPSPLTFFSWKQNRRGKKRLSCSPLCPYQWNKNAPVKYLNVLITKRLSSSNCLEPLPILFSTHFASHLIPKLLTSLFTMRGYPLFLPRMMYCLAKAINPGVSLRLTIQRHWACRLSEPLTLRCPRS